MNKTLVIATLFISPIAFAQGRHGTGSKAKHTDTTTAAGTTIRGTCSIAASASNPIAGPCVNLVIVLNDQDGNTVQKSRTSAQGVFEFTVEQEKTYFIVPGSQFYQLVSEKNPIKAGQKAAIVLQQK